MSLSKGWADDLPGSRETIRTLVRGTVGGSGIGNELEVATYGTGVIGPRFTGYVITEVQEIDIDGSQG